MDELGLDHMAGLFRRAMELLVSNGYDIDTTNYYHSLPEAVYQTMAEISEQVDSSLWGIDLKLCQMLGLLTDGAILSAG